MRPGFNPATMALKGGFYSQLTYTAVYERARGARDSIKPGA
jgi:hypothetical protein